MPAITNPAPVTPAVFGGMWVQSLNVFLPTEGKPKGFLTARLLPYDGTNLLALGGKDVRRALPPQEAQTIAMLAALAAECQRQADTEADVLTVTVSAQDPTQPVRVSIRFAGNTHHNIPDCFALAGTDAAFGAVFGATLAEIALLAGLSFTP